MSDLSDDEQGRKSRKMKLRNVFVSGLNSDESVILLSKHQLIYSILGLVLGFVCVIGGIILFLAGAIGAMSWTAKFLGASSEILDAAPGAVLFIVGLFVVFVTRYDVNAKGK